MNSTQQVEMVDVLVDELQGKALDWVVDGVITGAPLEVIFPVNGMGLWEFSGYGVPFSRVGPFPYSSDWKLGGHLLVKYGVALRQHSSGDWYAMLSSDLGDGECASWIKKTARGGEPDGPYSYQIRKRQQRFDAPDPLVALCRAVVASVHGHTVSVPHVLLASGEASQC